MTQGPTASSGTACRHAPCEDLADRCVVADLAWSERTRLLAVARRRVAAAAEAEDVVSEAMTRALECPDVDPARVSAWLTTVTIRLCIDHAREHARAPKRWHYAVRTYPRADEFESDIVDTLSAAAIAPLLDGLPDQQRRALQLRADGEPVAAIATAMSMTQKAAESLLGRARSSAKTIVRGLGSGVAVTTGWLRRPTGSPAPVVVPAAMALAVTTMAAVHLAAPGYGDAPRSGAIAQLAIAGHEPAPPVMVAEYAAARPIGAVVAGSAHSGSSSGPARTRPPSEVSVAGVSVHDEGAGHVRPDESLVESIRACVDGGVEVSPTYVGCRSGRPGQVLSGTDRLVISGGFAR